MSNVTEAEIRKRYATDFPFYASRNLWLRPKRKLHNSDPGVGADPKKRGLVRLRMNRAQLYLHERAEQQARETGKVRLIVLKARQEGISTYVAGRFYWKETFRFGKRVFILSHEQDATDNLFQMVKRYHDNCHELLRPSTSRSNAKELAFDKLDCDYRLATAKTKDIGRSQTIHYFHWSEVAFSPNAVDHQEGVLQAVPDEPGTEVIMESTANGWDPVFYPMWQDAMEGKGEYRPVFIPWFWMEEYSKPAPDRFQPDADEKTLMQVNDLTLNQIFWRRNKIDSDFKGDKSRFMREYPSDPEEAFQVTGTESFFSPLLVKLARKAKNVTRSKTLVVGVDPAVSEQGDRTAILFRWGKVAPRIDYYRGMDEVAIARLVADIIEEHKPVRVFIDSIGIGSGVCAMLKDWGYEKVVVRVNSASSPRGAIKANKQKKTNDTGPKSEFKNKRAQMFHDARQWLIDQPNQLPDDDEFAADMVALSYKYNFNNQLQIESKDDLKRRIKGVRSPDGCDAFTLTFAEPVRIPKPDVRSRSDKYINDFAKKQRSRAGFMGA